MSNLPDDWGMYWRTCPDCEARYHLSGTTVCDCVLCPGCGKVVEEEGLCTTCYVKAHTPPCPTCKNTDEVEHQEDDVFWCDNCDEEFKHERRPD